MSTIPCFYIPPLGIPLYWRNESSGELAAAVKHYFDLCCGPDPDEFAEAEGIAPMTERELKLICDYAVHFINAPCWENNMAAAEDMLCELKQLRERAKTLASVESIRRWNWECQEIGLDPF